jgi:hypothetical protein
MPGYTELAQKLAELDPVGPSDHISHPARCRLRLGPNFGPIRISGKKGGGGQQKSEILETCNSADLNFCNLQI